MNSWICDSSNKFIKVILLLYPYFIRIVFSNILSNIYNGLKNSDKKVGSFDS